MPDPVARTWEAATAVFDAAPICHVAFVQEGQLRVLPALHALVGTTLYLHGSPASSVIRAVASGDPLSISAVVLDGVAVAHSACHSALNYRSVLCSGTGREVEDPDEAAQALRAITERVIPGGWQRGRLPRPDEVAATAVAAVTITGFSLRARSGPAQEDEADRSLPGWTGIVPLRLEAGPAVPHPAVPAGLAPPEVLPGRAHS
ncbi:MAG: pyridoxamine 5'-phosphate oxidase family protein [Actinomycetota bacterium]